MTLINATLPAVVVAGALAAGILGLGTAPASAEPAPPPAPVVADPPSADPPPAVAPPKPAEFWDGLPVVWNSDWAGRWGVWTKDGFISLSPGSIR